MIYTFPEYKTLNPITLPCKLATGFTITKLQGKCSNCSKALVDVRGEVIEHDACSEVRFAGLCHDCKLLVTCQFRYYKDGHIIQHINGAWQPMMVITPLWPRLKRFLAKIFPR